MDGLATRNWDLPSYMVSDQKALAGGNWPFGNLTCSDSLQRRGDDVWRRRNREVNGLLACIAIESQLRAYEAVKVIVLQELSRAEQSELPTSPALIRFISASTSCSTSTIHAPPPFATQAGSFPKSKFLPYRY